MGNKLATVEGTMLTPGVSRNGRLYTRELIAKAVGRMQERIADPNGLPIVMRTHHEAGDDSQRIVGRITSVGLDEKGNANYKASLYNTKPAQDIAGLVTGDEPALKSVSIHGYWLSPIRPVKYKGQQAMTGDDLEIDAVDFTASPGVTGAVVTSASYYDPNATTETVDGRIPIFESMEATLTRTDEEIVEEVSDELEVYERKFTAAQRKSMASKGQAMAGGRYPIANKSDLRNAIRAVGRGKGSHDAIRSHIKKRAAALGLSNMIPDNWKSSGAKETVQVGDGDALRATEASIHVCVSDDQGKPIVTVCKDGVAPGDLKKDAKKAGKLAGRIADKNTNDADMTIMTDSDMDDDGDDDADDGYDSDDTGDQIDQVKPYTPPSTTASTDQVTNKGFVVKPGSDPYRETTKVMFGDLDVTEQFLKKSTMDLSESEAAMAEDTKAVQAAPEIDLTKIVGEAVTAALMAVEKQRADAKAARKAKESKKNKDEKKATETAEGTAEPTKAAEGVKESISVAELDKKLADERAKMLAEIRESIIKENGLPSRKGFRHVAESDTDVAPTGDELWDKRADVWAQFFPWGAEAAKAAQTADAPAAA